MIWHISNPSVSENYITNIGDSVNTGKDISIFIDGYIVPRVRIFEEYKNSSQKDMVKTLYKKFGLDLIHYIKGVFVLIIFDANKFFIFNDRHSVKKYFIYEKNENFFISNSLKIISDNFSLSLDKENVALFSLISHFINGHTLFKNVTTGRPAEIIEFDAGQLNRSYYWQPRNILKNRKIKKRIVSDYAQQWKRVINGYLTYLKPKAISLTLTGGNDSRMVLSALLSINSKFHAFTFGNPRSNDGVISEAIRHSANISHSNYFTENATSEWFRIHAEHIISFGNSLVNIHRAHRNDAAAAEINSHPETEMLFTGLVGGEYLKEPGYNNLTIPVLFESFLMVMSESDRLKIIENMLQEKGVRINNVDIQAIIKRIQEFLDYGNGLSEAEKKFVYTYLFYGCSHHTQDSNVFGHHIRYVVNPFMDIDFLELIAGYEKWYLNRKPSFFHKAFHSSLLVGITDYLAPELSVIPYAKKGAYSANELLNHKFKYIFKRLSHFIRKDGNQYPPNFPMGPWLYAFCVNELSKLNDELVELYDFKMLKRQLESVKAKTNEESWHIVTNPINVNLNYEYYKKA